MCVHIYIIHGYYIYMDIHVYQTLCTPFRGTCNAYAWMYVYTYLHICYVCAYIYVHGCYIYMDIHFYVKHRARLSETPVTPFMFVYICIYMYKYIVSV